MRRKRSKPLSLLLAVAMVLAMVPAVTTTALAADFAGDMADGVWKDNPRYIEFGEYGGEPLLWRVLEVYESDGSTTGDNAADGARVAFLVLDDVLRDVGGDIVIRQFHASSNDWNGSDIKAWLNSDSSGFLDDFTPDEAASIVTSDYTYGGSNTGSDTDASSKVFLLSKDEAENTDYFADNEERYASLSDWWLRSPGYNNNIAAVVIDDGAVHSDGNDVSSKCAIRPALKINLSSSIFTSSYEIYYDAQVTIEDASGDISGAHVVLVTGANAPDAENFSGSDGVAHLKVKAGTYDVTVTKAGYATVTDSITIGPSGNSKTVTLTADDSLPDEVYFGEYSSNPIKWRVLDIDKTSGKALLLADTALFQAAFDAADNDSWTNADIRATLNGTASGSFLYSDNFTPAEYAAIKTTDLSDMGTEDKVFLLSADEAMLYLPDNAARLVSSKGWWLRSEDLSAAAQADVVNNIEGYLQPASKADGTVYARPAMWVDLTKLTMHNSGGETSLKALPAAKVTVTSGGSAVNGAAVTLVYNGTLPVVKSAAGTDMTIVLTGTTASDSGAAFNLPMGTYGVSVTASGYNSGSGTLTVDSTGGTAEITLTASGNHNGGGTSYTNGNISPKTAAFDLNAEADDHAAIAVTLTRGSYSLSKITYDGKALVEGTDYTASGTKYTFTEEFLSGLAVGTHKITFDMSGGADPTLTITVADTTPEPEPEPEPEPKPWVNPFIDVEEDDWFYDAVRYVYENELMVGTSASDFAPDTPLSRAMMVQILWNLEGKPTAGSADFDDVASGAWYADAVAWASENGIVMGMDDGTFAPDTKITREQMAVMLYRYMEYKGIKYTVTEEYRLFADEDDISGYAKNAIQALNKLGIINGVGGNAIAPKAEATRAEVAQMIMNFMETIA